MSVIACKNGVVTTAFLPDCAMQHSVNLMKTVDDVMKRADLTVAACDFFAAAVGAGSFTGIRIGISAAKGFALAVNKPTLAVTSFDVIAYNAIEQNKGKILCLINALHDAYYVCGYENGEVTIQPAYLMEDEVLSLAAQGYALYACGALPIAQKAAVQVVSPIEGLQKAVEARCEQGAFGELSALYVRKSSAEMNVCK